METSASQSQFPRPIRVAPERLGWYVRLCYTDHRAIADAVAGGPVGLHGVVFDPVHEERHSELRQLILVRKRDAILDPKTQELGTKGGFNHQVSALPWALERPHRPDDFSDARFILADAAPTGDSHVKRSDATRIGSTGDKLCQTW